MNFSELSKVKNIILSALLQMGNIKNGKIKFMLHVFHLFLGIKGRLNFLQFERHGKYAGQTCRNQFEAGFDFLGFNKITIKEHAGDNLATVFDPSYISKSGKKTPGAGYFWSGVAARSKWGLEIGGLAVVDTENHTAFHLEAVQAVDLKERETLLEYYGRIILERKETLRELSQILLVDAYFSKITFVRPLVESKFTIISRLRKDADLKYLYNGIQKKGRGRPKKYDGKINIKELDGCKIKKVSELENEEIHSGIVFSKSLKMDINLVIVKKKTKGKWVISFIFPQT